MNAAAISHPVWAMRFTGNPSAAGTARQAAMARGAMRSAKARRRDFLAPLAMLLSLAYGAGLVVFWIVEPRLVSLHLTLAWVAGGLFLGASLALFVGVGVAAAGLILRSPVPGGGRLARMFGWLAPWVASVAPVLGITPRACLEGGRLVARQLGALNSPARPSAGAACLFAPGLPPAAVMALRGLCAEWDVRPIPFEPVEAGARLRRLRPAAILLVGLDEKSLPPQLGLDYMPKIIQWSPEFPTAHHPTNDHGHPGGPMLQPGNHSLTRALSELAALRSTTNFE